MMGMDVTNELHASFSCQAQSLKWWHSELVFFYLTPLLPTYIFYTLGTCTKNEFLVTPMIQSQLKTKVCATLVLNWIGQREDDVVEDIVKKKQA